VKGVLGLAAFVLVGWLIVKAKDQFWKGANQRVLARTKHAEGQQLVREQLVIRSSSEPSSLQDAIVHGLALPYEKPTAIAADLFQGPVRPGEVRFGSGTKLATQFMASMRVAPADAGGSVLTYKVDRWTLADGIVTGIPQLKYLRRRIEDEARKLDAGIVVTGAPVEQPSEP
jgi:hypothetical protein